MGLSKKQVTIVTGNFETFDKENTGTLNVLEATSLFYAVKNEICPDVTVTQFKASFAHHSKNKNEVELNKIINIMGDLCPSGPGASASALNRSSSRHMGKGDSTANLSRTPTTARHEQFSAATIKRKASKAVFDVGVWFGVAEDEGNSQWGLASAHTVNEGDELLGNMNASEAELVQQSTGLSRKKSQKMMKRLTGSSAPATAGAIAAAGGMSGSATLSMYDDNCGEEGMEMVKKNSDDNNEDSDSDEDGDREEQELLQKRLAETVEKEIDDLLALEQNSQRMNQVTVHTRQFLLDMRRQIHHTRAPTHYAYANWFESDVPVKGMPLVSDHSKKEVSFSVNPRKDQLVKRPLIDPPPIGKPTPKFNRQGQKLKPMSREVEMAFASRPKYRPWVNIITMLAMTILIFVEIGINGGVEKIGVSTYTASQNVSKFGNVSNTVVSVARAENMWIGPSTNVILEMGAKYSPCMKRDDKIYGAMNEQQQIMAQQDEGGCCVITTTGLSTTGQCSITSSQKCTQVGGSYRVNTTCQSQVDKGDCTTIFNRPCCAGLHGQCFMVGVDECNLYRGYRNDNAEQCSTAPYCLNEVCQMGGLKDQENPNQWWRYITPIFLHVGILHYFFNILMQLGVGVRIEIECGPVRFFLIFMISGIGGNIVSGIFSTYTPQVGSSGALYGLLAILCVELWQNWNYLYNPWTEFWKIFIMMFISLGIGTLPYVDNFAHFGGFLYGGFAAIVFLPYVTFGKHDIKRKRILLAIFGPILIIMLVVGFILFYTTTEDFCSFCTYINCIPYTPDFCASTQQTWSGSFY